MEEFKAWVKLRTSHESNRMQNALFSLICIRFDSCEVRRFDPQEWSISNFACGLNRNITSRRMKNVAFHCLPWWEMIVLPILPTITGEKTVLHQIKTFSRTIQFSFVFVFFSFWRIMRFVFLILKTKRLFPSRERSKFLSHHRAFARRHVDRSGKKKKEKKEKMNTLHDQDRILNFPLVIKFVILIFRIATFVRSIRRPFFSISMRTSWQNGGSSLTAKSFFFHINQIYQQAIS